MKKSVKLISIFLIMLIILSMCPSVFANELNTTLNVIQKSGEIKDLENNQGYISQTIVDSNSDTGEVTIEVKVSNTKKETQETGKYENTEIYLIVSENIVTDEAKFQKEAKNIENLAKKILKTNSKTKIGIIGVTGTINDRRKNENGQTIMGDKDEREKNGSIDNREIVVRATDNIETLMNGLKNMNPTKTKYYLNLQAAVSLGRDIFASDVNKILISLYDGVPAIAVGEMANIKFGGNTGKTLEEAVKDQHENISTRTANEIRKLKNTNISFIMLRPSNTSYDEEWINPDTGEVLLKFDGSSYVEKLYGTIEKPTYGKMYSFNDSNIDTIITENIYQDVKNLIQPNINNVKVLNYFSDDIINNFEFSYVGNPSIGTNSGLINKDTKTITWDIGELSGNSVAILKYKLKIKDMKNTSLLNKTISTNEKVVLTYTDNVSKDYTVESTNSPKIQLAEVKEELIATIEYNPTNSTTENVTATIKTNKKVNKVDGWNLSEDGKILTKTYSKNATEMVHLVSVDGLEKDVQIVINNITKNDNKPVENNTQKDPTVANGELPKTGASMTITICLVIVSIVSIIFYKRYNNYKDIK